MILDGGFFMGDFYIPVDDSDESLRGKLSNLIEKNWITEDIDREIIVDFILETKKPGRIFLLLEEYAKMQYKVANNQNMHIVACISRDLKKLNSPIVVGNDLSPWLIDFKFSQPWRKWSIWDIEREYLEILMLRGETSSFAPALKFLKKDVLTMLNLLIDCDVIYNFKTRDLFVNNMKGELESYFRNFKKIRVQTL